MMIWLHIPIDPSDLPTAQQKGERIVKRHDGTAYVHHYTKNKVIKATNHIKTAIRDLMDKQNTTGYMDKRQPVFVAVEYIYPIGSQPRKMQGSYKTTRPDIDNLLKGLFDACTSAKLWADDSQVIIGKAIKRYANAGEKPCIYLYLSDILQEGLPNDKKHFENN